MSAAGPAQRPDRRERRLSWAFFTSWRLDGGLGKPRPSLLSAQRSCLFRGTERAIRPHSPVGKWCISGAHPAGRCADRRARSLATTGCARKRAQSQFCVCGLKTVAQVCYNPRVWPVHSELPHPPKRVQDATLWRGAGLTPKLTGDSSGMLQPLELTVSRTAWPHTFQHQAL